MEIGNLERRYCINCESTAFVGDGFHIAEIGLGWLNCFGPFAFCYPPEVQEDWELFVDAPAPDELAEMDAVASELRLDFELV